jgi:hypothetical protein
MVYGGGKNHVIISNAIDMKAKQMYESPAAEAVVVVQERMICGPSEVKGTNTIKAWENGDTTTDEVYL